MTTRRTCIFVSETMLTKDGYIPSVVTEDEPGHAPLTGNGDFARPWYWGHDIVEARRLAREYNEQLGLSEDDVQAIILSSMRASS